MAYSRQTLSTAKDTNVKSAIGIPGWAQALIDGNLDARDAQLAFSKAPQLYRSVTLRAHAMAGVPYCIYRGGPSSTTEVEWPFPQTLTKLIYELEASLLVSGAGFLLKLQPSMGGKRVVGLQYLSPSTMQVVYTDNKMTFIQNVRGQRYGPWDADRLVYMREFSFTDDVGPGLAPAKVALPAANLRIALSDFATGFFASGGQPLTLLTLSGNPPPTEVERTEAFFKRTMAGVRNAWRVLAVRSEVTVTPITPEIRTMAMPELADASTREIAAAFGIPLSLLTSDSANFATAQSDMRLFYENTVKPRLLMYETAFNEQLLRPMGLRLQFHPEEMQIFQTDEAERSGSLKNLVEAGIDLKTAMSILGYHVSDIAGAQMSPDAQAGESMPKPAYSADTQEGETPPLLSDLTLGKAVPLDSDYAISLQLYAAQAQKKSIDTEAKTWARLSLKDRQRATDFSCNHLAPEQEEWLKRQLRTTTATPEHLFEAATKTLTLRSKAEKMVATEVRVAFLANAARIRQAAASGQVDEATVRRMIFQVTDTVSPILAQVFNKKLIVASTTGGVPVDREKYKTASQVWAENHKIQLGKELEATTLKDLQQAVVELVQDPRERVENLDEALRLRLFKTLGPYRTKMIAITEVARAKSAAINEFYDELIEDDEPGEQSAVKRWATQLDEKVCAICGPLDDTLQEVWINSFPEGPPAHPNCRCEIGVEKTKPAEVVPAITPPVPPPVSPAPVAVVVPAPALVPAVPLGQPDSRKMNGAALRTHILNVLKTEGTAPIATRLIATSKTHEKNKIAIRKFQRTFPKQKHNESNTEFNQRKQDWSDQEDVLIAAYKDAQKQIEDDSQIINARVHELLLVDDPIQWTIKATVVPNPYGGLPVTHTPTLTMLTGADFSQSIISSKVLPIQKHPDGIFTVNFLEAQTGDRSSATDGTVYIKSDAEVRTAVHELGHILDAQSKTLVNSITHALATEADSASGSDTELLTARASFAHMENRTKPKAFNKSLGKTLGVARMNSELYRVHKAGTTPMIDLYAAKDYSELYRHGSSVQHPFGVKYGDTASEVLSVGMELLYENPAHLAANDPALFEYVINVIRGTRP